MQYDITLKNNINDEIKIWSYDTYNNIIKDEKGIEINIPDVTLPQNLKKITIQLGFSCNMSCDYCLQSKSKKKYF